MILPTLAIEITGLAVTAFAALVIVWKGLIVPALLGLLVYAWSCLLADRFAGVRIPTPGNCTPVQIPAAMQGPGGAPRWPAITAGTLVGVLVITAFVLLILWSVRLGSAAELRTFLLRIEGSLDILRHALPEWLAVSIPEDLTQLKDQVFALLRSKAAMLSSLGGTIVHTVVVGIFAILVGALAAVATWQPGRLLSDKLFIARLLLVLERVVIAQLKIAIFNSTMTALYLFLILPAFGFQLPFRGLLVLFTLVTGVLPVLGNLLANTVLALISFAISPWLALASLVYLIAIHKTEYFINARTVGSRVQVASWEILAAMLTGESVFGIPGLVTAPLLYPFFKRELLRLRRMWPGSQAAGGPAEAAAVPIQPADPARAADSAQPTNPALSTDPAQPTDPGRAVAPGRAAGQPADLARSVEGTPAAGRIPSLTPAPVDCDGFEPDRPVDPSHAGSNPAALTAAAAAIAQAGARREADGDARWPAT